MIVENEVVSDYCADIFCPNVFRHLEGRCEPIYADSCCPVAFDCSKFFLVFIHVFSFSYSTDVKINLCYHTYENILESRRYSLLLSVLELDVEEGEGRGGGLF